MIRSFNSKMRKFATAYVNRWWLPSLVALIALGLFSLSVVAELMLKLQGEWLQVTLFAVLGVSMLGVLVAAIWNFSKKRWWRGSIFLLAFGGTTTVIIAAFVVISFAYMFGPSEDHFADNLTIPTNIEIAEPLKMKEGSWGGPEDVFQTALLEALQKPGSGDATVQAELPSLVQLHKSSEDILRRYLASSPAWRMFSERGRLFATRRWMIGSQWEFTLHGNYDHSTFDHFQKDAVPKFQTRLTLGISGKPWWEGWSTTKIRLGEKGKVRLGYGNQLQESHCIINTGVWPVEIFEQSGDPERKLTKASLQQLEEELRPLAKAPTWETIRKLLPPGSIGKGVSSLNLSKSFQGGIYDSQIWVNPGEPGMLYLKAFEVTQGTPLSVKDLKESTSEWVGWSDDPSELFFANTNFTIYEGEWDKFYAARFEVWFVPDSGKPERKLLERNFKIEGWQR